jgi:hypothetical protein
MKILIFKFIFGLLVCGLINNSLFAQSYFDIDNCTILDSNNEPVPYAAIELINTHVATISDINGNFSLLKLPKIYINDTLRLSHLAYSDTIISIKRILSGEKHIYMKEQNNTLNEVVVKPGNIHSDIKALNLLRLAIDKINDNYSDSIYSQMGEFHFLTISEISGDSIVFVKGIDNILLPSIIHNIQNLPNQQVHIDTLYDEREKFLKTTIDSSFNYRSLIPFFCDYRVIGYYLNYGIIGNAFPLTNKNIYKYNYHIKDTVYINNSHYVRIKLTPKDYSSFSFHGKFVVNTNNYHIKNINLNLVRHKSNVYREKSLIIGAKNMNILMPIYDLSMEIGFTNSIDNKKSFLSNVDIEAAFNIIAPSMNIDTDRIKTTYRISNFAQYKTNNNKLRQKNPTRMQKRLMKKIKKIIKES